MGANEKVDDRLTPLVVGVTGHRDLLPSETDELKRLIADLFLQLKVQFPHTPIRLITALAEGADRLAAYAAIEAGVAIQAILPMPASLYRHDFESPESRVEFDSLCAGIEVIELPADSAAHRTIESGGSERDLSYAVAGMFISAHCHILLALWDGKQSKELGGTSQIIYFQHYDRLPGVSESVPRTSLFLTDDESDLVYHIGCSRQMSSGSQSAVTPFETRWYTADPEAPRMETMPARYCRVFQRADEYNSDILHVLSADRPLESVEPEPPRTETHNAAEHVRSFFHVANALADSLQNRVDRALATIYTLALLTGLSFILYSELTGIDFMIFPFLAFLLTGIMIARVARRRQWHRKYLDYRVLAEGLRVQYYRTVVGLSDDGYTKFAYDNFLRQRDMELGWIRNVMRVAGIASDALPHCTNPVGLEFAIRHWIGTSDSPGQLQYYRERTAQRSYVNRLSDNVAQVCLWGGIAVAVFLALSVEGVQGSPVDGLKIMMGVLPLIAGVAEVYTQRKADRELTKQYRFMEHVFANARRRLDQATTDTERLEVMKGLGDAALSEHAEWILVRRERQPEPTGF